jgi:hypothetical protein
MLSSQSGGNPELGSVSGRTQCASGKQQNTVEMPVFGQFRGTTVGNLVSLGVNPDMAIFSH